MSLGRNANRTKEQFVNAMRDRLEEIDDEDSRAAALEAINNEGGEVQKNLGALGEAVYTILTEDAEIFSDEDENEDFWNWVRAVNNWLRELRRIHPDLPAPPAMPTQLRGKIR